MRGKIIGRIKAIAQQEQGFNKNLMRWKNFNVNEFSQNLVGKEPVHLSETDFSIIPNNYLLVLFERIIRQCSKKM